MDIKNLENKFKIFEGSIYFNYSLKKLNWFNIGGNTKIYFKPNSLNDLIDFLKLYKDNKNLFDDQSSNKIDININYSDNDTYKKIQSLVHEVTQSIDNFQMNVGVAKIYQLVNLLTNIKQKNETDQWIMRNGLSKLIRVTEPMMPHLSEECWHIIGNKDLIVEGVCDIEIGKKSNITYVKDKSYVKMMYEKYDVLNTLFPLTASCIGWPHETNDGQHPCRICVWCKERLWAFGSNDFLLDHEGWEFP